MLRNMRKIVSNAIGGSLQLNPNVSSGASKENDTEMSMKTNLNVPNTININAGRELLQRNEDLWEDMHKANEENASIAEMDRVLIEQIKHKFNTMQSTLMEMTSCLESITDIARMVDNCMMMIEDVTNKCHGVEVKLIEMQNIVEEEKLQKEMMDQYTMQVELYKKNKMEKLGSLQRKLEEKHKGNIKQLEREVKIIQQERQSVFEDVFHQDLQTFKEHGFLPKIETLEKHSNSEVGLEEITLHDEEGEEALEHFLNS